MIWIIFSLIIISLIKLVPTVLPLKTVEWILSKFETHIKLSIDNPLRINGQVVTGEPKKELIENFNQAHFMKKSYIYPGTEHLYLPPEKDGSPLVIETKIHDKATKIYLYKEKNSIDVVRVRDKKMVYYNISSNSLLRYLQEM